MVHTCYTYLFLYLLPYKTPTSPDLRNLVTIITLELKCPLNIHDSWLVIFCGPWTAQETPPFHPVRPSQMFWERWGADPSASWVMHVSDTACYEIHVRLKVHHRVKSFWKYWSPLLLTYNKVLLFNVYLVIPATNSTCMITARDLSQGCRHTTVVYNQFNASKAFVILQLQVKSLRHTPFYLLRKET